MSRSSATQPADPGPAAQLVGEDPAANHSAELSGQSGELPGQQLEPAGALRRSRPSAYRQQRRRASYPALRHRPQKLAVQRHAERRHGQRADLQADRNRQGQWPGALRLPAPHPQTPASGQQRRRLRSAAAMELLASPGLLKQTLPWRTWFMERLHRCCAPDFFLEDQLGSGSI